MSEPSLTEFLLAGIAEDEANYHMARASASAFLNIDRPGRMLAECEAKRRIVEGASGESHNRWILQELALPYADHPDYREEWRP